MGRRRCSLGEVVALALTLALAGWLADWLLVPRLLFPHVFSLLGRLSSRPRRPRGALSGAGPSWNTKETRGFNSILRTLKWLKDGGRRRDGAGERTDKHECYVEGVFSKLMVFQPESDRSASSRFYKRRCLLQHFISHISLSHFFHFSGKVQHNFS